MIILQQNEIGDTVSSEAGEVHVPGERDNSDQTGRPEHVPHLGKWFIF